MKLLTLIAVILLGFIAVQIYDVAERPRREKEIADYVERKRIERRMAELKKSAEERDVSERATDEAFFRRFGHYPEWRYPPGSTPPPRVTLAGDPTPSPQRYQTSEEAAALVSSAMADPRKHLTPRATPSPQQVAADIERKYGAQR